MNFYQLQIGEYELEEVGEMEEEIEEGEEREESTMKQGGARIRTRPQMKLIGRPVFIYIPRYFRKNKDYNYQYHRIDHPQRNPF